MSVIYIVPLSFFIFLAIMGFVLWIDNNESTLESDGDTKFIGEILDDYSSIDDVELSLSYPVWEVCNSLRNDPLDWKKE